MDLRETLRSLASLLSGKHSDPTRKPRPLTIDPLEGRWVPAVLAEWTAATGKLEIEGDNEANNIVVSVVGGVVQITNTVNGVVEGVGVVGGAPAAVAVTKLKIDLWGNTVGTDKLDVSAVSQASGFTADLDSNITINGGSGQDEIKGTQFSDWIYGDGESDTIFGNNDDDVIHGNDGADSLFGGEGTDRIEGDAHGDSIWGGEGYDNLYGGTGEDSIFGEGGNDYMRGGEQNDSLFGGEGDDQLYGETGDDHFDGGGNTAVGDTGFATGDTGDTKVRIETWVP